MTRLVEIHGEMYMSVETAAECYRVEARWIEEVHPSGLLRGERVGDSLALPARELDRLAAVLRWRSGDGAGVAGGSRAD